MNIERIAPVDFAPWNTANRGIAFQMLSYSNILPLSVVLGTIAHLPKSFCHVGVNVMTANLHPALRRCLLGDDDLHCRGLAGAVMT